MKCNRCGWQCMTCHDEFCCPICGEILVDEREIEPDKGYVGPWGEKDESRLRGMD